MRPLFLAFFLATPTALLAIQAQRPAADGPIQADWLRDGVKDRERAALTSLGWRLEEDGRALDPKTKVPVTQAVLAKALRDLRQGARRAALETVNLMLASDEPLTAADKDKIGTLSPDLPPALVTALLDPNSDLKAVKAMAGNDLSRTAAYFDGGRTMADRRAAAEPVSAGTPGPRVELPYFTATEKTAGEKLRSSAASEIGRVPYGKTVLARLTGPDGKPELPPIVIEDQFGAVAAQYDYRRGAIVLDRETVLASVVGTVPPAKAAALRLTLLDRTALMSYLDKHPEAVAAVVKDNEIVLVHELTHAWQDRRDPVFSEMARGNLPDTQPLEYEEEAYATKNLYLHSKLKSAPASVKRDGEFTDYLTMMHGRASWATALYKDLNDSSPSRALPLKSVEDVQAARLAALKGRGVVTPDDQQAKALDLKAAGQGQKALAALAAEHDRRMTALNGEIDAAGAEISVTLGRFYLAQARASSRATDRAYLLDEAERRAKASGNAKLIEEVRKERAKKP